MRPRPFKFFFALSLGILAFLFLARFVFVAFLLAAVLSVVFFIGQKIKSFFLNVRWEQGYPSSEEYHRPSSIPVWKDDLLMHYPNRERSYRQNYRVIKIG